MEADKSYFTATFPALAVPTSQLSDIPGDISFPLNEAVFLQKGPLCFPGPQGKPLASDPQRTNTHMTIYKTAPKLCLSESPAKKCFACAKHFRPNVTESQIHCKNPSRSARKVFDPKFFRQSTL